MRRSLLWNSLLVAAMAAMLSLLAVTAPVFLREVKGATPEKGGGVVSVLYAGSLVAVNERALGPAFQQATGYTYQGEGHGSVAAARMIKDRLRSPDIFISADPTVNAKELMGPKNRDLVVWYLTFASSSLVIAYHPKSRFRDGFEQARAGKLPWYEVLARPGVKLGRTDPNLDPKGYRTLFLFELAERWLVPRGLRLKAEAA